MRFVGRLVVVVTGQSQRELESLVKESYAQVRRSQACEPYAQNMTAALHIAIGADHAGYSLKQHLIDFLRTAGHTVDDLGTHSTESCDYPPICAGVGRAVRDGKAQLGIVLGGSGQGEQLAANKVMGVRAALCNCLYTARMAREHNNANVLSMGARVVGIGLAEEIVQTFLATPFEGGRHERRVEQLGDIEREEAKNFGAQN